MPRPRERSRPGALTLLSADWGKQARKRAVYAARAAPRWVIGREEPPAAGWNLAGLVERGERLRDRDGAALVAIDAVIGLPAPFGQATGAAGFREALRRLEASGGLSEACVAPDQWRPGRPFFRVPPGKGSLTRFVAAAGGRDAVLREIERRTGAKPVFVLSGIPGSVGSGSRALWRELVTHERGHGPVSVWPFDGALAELLSKPGVVLAESYPRAAYAIALGAELPSRVRPLAKTHAEARKAALDALRHAAWPWTGGVLISDRDAAEANEDDFDALMVAAALVRLVAEGRPLDGAAVDPVWEGGILGTGAVDLTPRRRAARRRGARSGPHPA